MHVAFDVYAAKPRQRRRCAMVQENVYLFIGFTIIKWGGVRHKHLTLQRRVVRDRKTEVLCPHPAMPLASIWEGD